MGPIFDAYKILTCVLCLIFSSSLCLMFISRISIMRPCLYRSFICRFFSSFFHQGFLSHGFILVTIIWNFDRHFSLIKCRLPYLPIVTLSSTISLDMTLVDNSTPVGSSFLALCLGRKDGGCSSGLSLIR
jgi:hypothetical protein